MNINKLPTIVLTLILTALIIGVGVLTLDLYGSAAKERITISNESFTVPQLNKTVSLAYGNITEVTQILNASGDIWNTSLYIMDLEAGTLNNSQNSGACTNGTTCYAYYLYDEYETDTALATIASRNDIGDISNVWMSLVITLIILSLIMYMVISNFVMKNR